MADQPTAVIDPEPYYQQLFDALGQAYWQASDSEAKEQIQRTRDATHKILADIHRQKIEATTADLLALSAKIKDLQPELKAIQAGINKIVHNVDAAGKLEAAVAGVLSLAEKA